MNKDIKVSFDFDNTLSKESVQNYVRELKDKGYDVWIVTSRYADCSDYFGYKGLILENCHKDLLTVADKLDIPRNQIIYTNMDSKWKRLLDLPNVKFHLDDDQYELREIQRFTTAKAISVMSSSWIKKCNKILNEK
jgi:hypothetical protein